MRRYTPDEFFMLISSRKVSDKMQNALRLWLVDGMAPSEAAERCRVERSGLYKAFDRMRGHDRFDLRSIRVRVPHAQACFKRQLQERRGLRG